MQPKLLRVLEEKEFERFGGNTALRSDFRVITATNQHLDKMVAEGKFRKDLFYRLNVIPLHVPPLRERRNDIVPIARHLLKNLCEEATLADIRLAQKAEDAFRKYDWPGNVREMSNVLERALSTLDGLAIEIEHLPFYLSRRHLQLQKNGTSTIRQARMNAEESAILRALEETDHNKVQAAHLLGIHRTLLYKRTTDTSSWLWNLGRGSAGVRSRFKARLASALLSCICGATSRCLSASPSFMRRNVLVV
jgi:transcriptional regulator with PAS, ATPase and Fis domain